MDVLNCSPINCDDLLFRNLVPRNSYPRKVIPKNSFLEPLKDIFVKCQSVLCLKRNELTFPMWPPMKDKTHHPSYPPWWVSAPEVLLLSNLFQNVSIRSRQRGLTSSGHLQTSWEITHGQHFTRQSISSFEIDLCLSQSLDISQSTLYAYTHIASDFLPSVPETWNGTQVSFHTLSLHPDSKWSFAFYVLLLRPGTQVSFHTLSLHPDSKWSVVPGTRNSSEFSHSIPTPG